MHTVIGVRFRKAGKIYYYDSGLFDIHLGQSVIVETDRGIEYGIAVTLNKRIEKTSINQPLTEVLRLATEADKHREEESKEKEKKAFQICREKIREHGLEMKLVDTEVTFDNNQMVFYFTADNRIDFRDLVKDLASIFRTRIELRQIGVRDETKIQGGIGICGKSLCCATFLPELESISIKMAKGQNLPIDPTKLSGVCGRLMCCLKYEDETCSKCTKKSCIGKSNPGGKKNGDHNDTRCS